MKDGPDVDRWLAECRRKGLIIEERPTGLLGLPDAPAGQPERGKVFVVVPVPPPSNHLYPTVRGRRVKSREYKAWLEANVPTLATLATPAEFPVEVLIVIIPGSGWRGDIANREKATVDGLVAAGVLPGDSPKHVAGLRIGFADRTTAAGSYVRVWFQPRSEWWQQ